MARPRRKRTSSLLGRVNSKKAESEPPPPLIPPRYDLTTHTHFQSHKQEFDPLKSLEIDERIVSMEFLPPVPSGLLVLAANGKHFSC